MSNIQTRNNGIIPGFEGIDLSRAAKPINCEIVQESSKHQEKGMFRFDTGEVRAQLTQVVPLLFKRTNVLYGKQMGGDPRCASDDGKTPAARIQNPVRQSCAGCPMLLWDKNDEKVQMAISLEKPVKDRPLCRENWMILFVDQGSQIPYWLTVFGEQIKTLNEQLIRGLMHRGVSPFMASVDVKLQTKSNGAHKYYTTYYSNITKLDDFSMYQGLYERYNHIVHDMLTKEYEEKMSTNNDDEVPF